MTYILTHPTLISSARVISRELKLPVFVQPQATAPAIRWGNCEGFFKTDTTFNSPHSINVCSSKTKFSAAMRSAGISCLEMQTGVPERLPVVVRTVSGGHGGEGIVVCETETEWGEYSRYPWTYWEDFRWEIGVHVLGGKVAKVFSKIWDRPDEVPKYPIRNTELGWRFSLRNPSIYEHAGLSQFIEKFYAEFPIEMCRLDVGRTSTGLMLIECNSAPSLSANANTAAMYLDFLKEQLK